MVNITIDNQKISVPSGTTIMEAAAKLGTPIPKLCYLKDINEIAACRVCVVEIERKIDQVQVICNLLKCTVPASDTGCTFAVMLGKDKLYSLSSCNAYFWAVGVDHHALGHNVITGGDQTIFPFNLNNTDACAATTSVMVFLKEVGKKNGKYYN